MTSTIIFILVITITAMVSSTAASDRPPYIECQSSEECKPGSCCSLQPNRYSFPQCTPMLQQNQVCIPSPRTVNTTLGYPDGSQVEIWNVYYIMCPCASGLHCSRTDNGKCMPRISNDV